MIWEFQSLHLSPHKRRKVRTCKIHDDIGLSDVVFVRKTEVGELVIARIVEIRFYEWKADWIVFDYFRFRCLIEIYQSYYKSTKLWAIFHWCLVLTSTCKELLKTEHWISGVATINRRADAAINVRLRGVVPLAMMTTKHQLVWKSERHFLDYTIVLT